MKLILHILTACLLLAAAGTAQAQARFDASAWAALAMSQIDGDGAGRYNHPGLAAGIETSFALGSTTSPLRAAAGLGWIGKGSRIEAIGRTIDLGYIQLPLMLTATMAHNRLRLGAGVAPAVLVHAAVLDDGVPNAAQADNCRRLDALPLLLSARYLLADNWGIEARFENSMLPVTKQSGSGTYRLVRSNMGVFNRVLTIGLVYRWKPSK